jgi:hypothetical protein
VLSLKFTQRPNGGIQPPTDRAQPSMIAEKSMTKAMLSGGRLQ